MGGSPKPLLTLGACRCSNMAAGSIIPIEDGSGFPAHSSMAATNRSRPRLPSAPELSPPARRDPAWEGMPPATVAVAIISATDYVPHQPSKRWKNFLQCFLQLLQGKGLPHQGIHIRQPFVIRAH